MSTGHTDDVPEPSDELRALLTTEVMCDIAALVVEAQVVRGYQVPYVFGTSEDGKKIYPSSDVPEKLSDGEHDFHSDAGCAWHELGEWYLMERLGLVYDDAHSLVTWCVERPMVEQIMRLDFAGYQRAFAPYIIKDEVEKLLVCPPDLYMGPYLADAAPALVAAIRAAQMRAEAGVKVGRAVLHKGSDDQPRDEHGRWTAEGGKGPEELHRVEAGDKVDGLVVRDDVPNTSSISASMSDNHESLGLREVPFSDFTGSPSKKPIDRVRDLAEQIKESGEVNPLIVVYESFDKEKGPYVLEGSHRFDALGHLGKKSFPALVVVDHGDEAQQAGKVSKAVNDQPRDEQGRFAVAGGESKQVASHEVAALHEIVAPALAAAEAVGAAHEDLGDRQGDTETAESAADKAEGTDDSDDAEEEAISVQRDAHEAAVVMHGHLKALAAASARALAEYEDKMIAVGVATRS